MVETVTLSRCLLLSLRLLHSITLRHSVTVTKPVSLNDYGYVFCVLLCIFVARFIIDDLLILFSSR